MPNVNSNGKFGTSMDYSQMLDVRRKIGSANFISVTNPTNSPLIKPRLNMDSKTRGLDNVIDAFGNRGLENVYPRIGLWRI